MADEQQGPASAGPPPGYRLKGPAHAHDDAPCGPECYELVPPATPELDRQSEAIRDGAHRVGEFLDWLDENGYAVAQRHEDDYGEEHFVPSATSKRDLVAAFFKIDMDKIEAERQALLDYLREINS